jgi:hypothetical protein
MTQWTRWSQYKPWENNRRSNATVDCGTVLFRILQLPASYLGSGTAYPYWIYPYRSSLQFLQVNVNQQLTPLSPFWQHPFCWANEGIIRILWKPIKCSPGSATCPYPRVKWIPFPPSHISWPSIISGTGVAICMAGYTINTSWASWKL